MIEFFQPEAVKWLLLSAVIVLIYFLKFHRQPVSVSSLRLWREALAERTLWQRIQLLVSCAVQVMLLCLLVAAMLEPFFPTAIPQARSVVIVIDNSASMNATDLKPVRFQAARQAALDVIKNLGPRDRLAIISTAPQARLVHTYSADKQSLQAAVEQLETSDTAGSMVEAIAWSEELLSDRRSPHLFMFTDGAIADEAECKALLQSTSFAEKQVLVKQFLPKEQPVNFAITHVGARPDPLQPEFVHVLVKVKSYASYLTSLIVQLQLQGEVIYEESVVLLPNPDEVGEFTHKFELTEDALLTVKLKAEDDLAADNFFSLWLKPGTVPSVKLLVGQLPAQKAIAESLKKLPIFDSQTGSNPELSVILGQSSQPLPSGNLIVTQPVSHALWPLIERKSSAGKVFMAEESDWLDELNLQQVVLEEVDHFQLPEDAEILCSKGESPLIAMIPREEGDVLWINLPLDEQTDLHWREAWPRLLSAAIHYMTARSDLTSRTYQADESAVLPQREADKSWKVVSPTGKEFQLPAELQMFGPLDRTGIWMISQDASSQEPFFLISNFGDSLESNLNSQLEEYLQDERKDVQFPQSSEPFPLWVLLVGLAMILSLMDWVCFQKREHV